MAFCARCGHDLGEAPACARCGTVATRYAQPGAAGHTSVRMRAVDVDDGGDTAERPAVATDTVPGRHAAPPVVPLPSTEPPPFVGDASSARFPLFADEVVSPRQPPTPAVAPAAVAGRDRSMSDLLPWVFLAIAAVGLLLVAAVWLLFRPGGDATAGDVAADAVAGAGSDPGDAGAAAEGDAQTEEADEAEDQGGRGDASKENDKAQGRRSDNVAATATALVPTSAPPGRDVDGRLVRYNSAQMFDGDPTTTWRMSGDGTDALITIRLAEPVEVSKVGLVNGYAKQDVDRQGRTVRWYPRNRRITAVTWSFDDGSVLAQDLRQRPEMQMTKVDGEVTRTIRLRLVDVTAPMPGRLGRNYTAISEIRIKGLPAG